MLKNRNTEAVLNKYMEAVSVTDTLKFIGRIIRIQGVLIESQGPDAFVGEMCYIIPADESIKSDADFSVSSQVHKKSSSYKIAAEVIAVRGKIIQLISYDSVNGLRVGDIVAGSGRQSEIAVGNEMLGRIIDSLGRPLDLKPAFTRSESYFLDVQAPSPMTRKPVSRRINTGIRAVDALLPVGCGQRMGIFAGSGVGKSTLLGMIARNTTADVNVIALIGERGREVREFIENDLGPKGLERSVLIVSTSDTSAVSRVRGAYAATAVAEYFRDQGKDVMLFFDSVTRLAMSMREIGLARGEPPSSRSYTPSVFSTLPRLFERAGVSGKGTITAFYTVLVEGDDLDEPISDAVRGYLDGHIVLSRKLAQKSHYPAIDILDSISRLAPGLMGPNSMRAMNHIKKLESAYRAKEDLIDIGAYAAGSDIWVDEAIAKRKEIDDFLTQDITEKDQPVDIFRKMINLSGITPSESETSGNENETLSVFA